jgi:hypothetical protein
MAKKIDANVVLIIFIFILLNPITDDFHCISAVHILG